MSSIKSKGSSRPSFIKHAALCASNPSFLMLAANLQEQSRTHRSLDNLPQIAEDKEMAELLAPFGIFGSDYD